MPSVATASVREVADELVSLCRNGRHLDAVARLYSPDIVSIEPVETKEMPARTAGIEAVRRSNEMWFENNEIHTAELNGPYVGENQFATQAAYDVTFKPTGQRMQMTEMALYTVKAGKIVQCEFFYHMPG